MYKKKKLQQMAYFKKEKQAQSKTYYYACLVQDYYKTATIFPKLKCIHVLSQRI